MEDSKTIAHEIGGVRNDTFRFGLQGVKSDIVGSHPLESSYHSTKARQQEMKRKILANTYGSALPMKLELDRQILSRFQRPPGAIPSSMLGLESLTGGLEDFAFEDYLNDPKDSESFRPVDMHHGVEVRLGLSKGPVCPSFN
ncbi:cyclin-B1-2-like [Solanum dulcamara]|uniref:cyclin-B1-2-like n=1 Tax=Solanum dulcamara TaxID=45834 RepID=UPI0024869A72|nr:cyclin-B1-2-like [Solanum dulcamara]